MADDVAIRVNNVKKSFKLPHERQTSIKSLFINIFRGKRTYETQQVLNGIDFEIKKGEFFGIVGRNGSGKSTLLKLLAGIYTPDEGSVQVNGKLTPFIELGVGFNPELTGRENVYLNGALLGFNRKEMDGLYDEIVEFAELEQFMDQKLKNYSSGMQVRLAFSIAIRGQSDILVLDEVLAVGDAAFQNKCIEIFEQYKANNQTIVLVTHDMETVKRFCSKALLINDGVIKTIDTPKKVADQYTLDNMNPETTNTKHLNDTVKKLEIKALSPKSLESKDFFEFEVSYELSQDIEVGLGIALMNDGKSVIEHNTKDLDIGSKKDKLYKIRYKLPLKHLTPKQFGIDVAIFKKPKFELIGFNTNSCQFIVTSKFPQGGILSEKGEWILSRDSS